MPRGGMVDLALRLDQARVADLIARGITTPTPAPAPEPPPVVVTPPTPAVELHPELFLAEQYRLSIFRGDIHRDELIANGPTLAPGASQKIVLATRIKTTEQRSQQTCILDSQTTETAKAVNDRLETASDERYGSERYDYGMHGHFHGEGSVGFGDAEADANVDVSGSTNDIRQEFGSSLGHVLDQQVSSANSARHEQAQTATVGTSFEKTEYSTVEVEVRNTTDFTQNYGVFQVKEEIISVLSLVDVKLIFANGNKADERKVSIYKVNELLDQMIADDVTKTTILRRLKTALSTVRDYREEVQSILRDDPGATGFAVDRNVTQQFEVKDSRGAVRRVVSVPGIIVQVYRHYVRKPGVTVLLPLLAT